MVNPIIVFHLSHCFLITSLCNLQGTMLLCTGGTVDYGRKFFFWYAMKVHVQFVYVVTLCQQKFQLETLFEI